MGELTDDERNMWYRKTAIPDLSEAALSSSFAGFSLPSVEEGFDSIRFDWKPEGDCTKMLKDWILEKKLTQRVDDLKPGAWFQEQWTNWQKTVQAWRKKQGEWKDPAKKKLLLQKKKRGEKKAEDGHEKDE